MIINFFRWVFLVIVLFSRCLAGFPVLFFGKNATLFYRKQAIKLGNNCLSICGAKATWDGLENMDPNENYVFIGNHQSFMDISLLFASLGSAGRYISFMAKKELFSIPIFGRVIKAMKLVPVERGESKEALRAIFNAIDRIKQGDSLVIFPEGTRTTNGELQPFKKGGFVLAERTGMKIVPFVLDGTMNLMPSKTFKITPGPVHISFLKPIDPTGLKSREIAEIIEKQIHEKLNELRAR